VFSPSLKIGNLYSLQELLKWKRAVKDSGRTCWRKRGLHVSPNQWRCYRSLELMWLEQWVTWLLIRGGTSEIAVYALGGIFCDKFNSCLQDDDFTNDNGDYMRRFNNLLMANAQAERIKNGSLGCMPDLENPPEDLRLCKVRLIWQGTQKKLWWSFMKIRVALRDKSITKIEKRAIFKCIGDDSTTNFLRYLQKWFCI